VIIDPVTGAPAAIRYEGVHKSFGTNHVLRGLDLIVPRGKITAIIGRSGTGKSVTLKHVMGLLRPDRGEIVLGDVNLMQLNPKALRRVRERFGVVFQNAALFDSMDVFDNVAFPLLEHESFSSDVVRAKVTAALAQVGLSAAVHRLPSELSGGMRKRVGLARALIRDPEFLLYDEPTTGLDPILSAAMDELIYETQQARPALTSVIISHDMKAVLAIADKVAFLVDGRVVHEGTPEYFAQSDDALIRQFLAGSLDGPMKV
jgi:phospholipid/cholesterol/gamma-HCH transport system ATP-binding protein